MAKCIERSDVTTPVIFGGQSRNVRICKLTSSACVHPDRSEMNCPVYSREKDLGEEGTRRGLGLKADSVFNNLPATTPNQEDNESKQVKTSLIATDDPDLPEWMRNIGK